LTGCFFFWWNNVTRDWGQDMKAKFCFICLLLEYKEHLCFTQYFYLLLLSGSQWTWLISHLVLCHQHQHHNKFAFSVLFGFFGKISTLCWSLLLLMKSSQSLSSVSGNESFTMIKNLTQSVVDEEPLSCWWMRESLLLMMKRDPCWWRERVTWCRESHQYIISNECSGPREESLALIEKIFVVNHCFIMSLCWMFNFVDLDPHWRCRLWSFCDKFLAVNFEWEVSCKYFAQIFHNVIYKTSSIELLWPAVWLSLCWIKFLPTKWQMKWRNCQLKKTKKNE
jgi:hypothetical protein